LQEAENFITDRFHFAEDVNYPFVLALYASMTHCYWECQFAVPYLGVRADAEGEGKTRLVEIVGSMCLNPSPLLTDPTGASLLRRINRDHPTLLLDESEELQDVRSITHRIFNAGYKPGAVVPRADGRAEVTYQVYCPKIFGMIGDPDRTIRSRSIMVKMEKGDIEINDKSPVFNPLAVEIGTHLNAMVTPVMDKISSTYLGYTNMLISVLPIPRDREIWECLFAICEVICPERLDELTTACLAISTLKTAPARRYASLEAASVDSIAYEYSKYLTRDCYEIAKRLGEKNIHTHVLQAELVKMPMWIHYQSPKGVKIGDKSNGHFVLADMLQRVAGDDSEPKTVKVKGKGLKGYTLEWLEKAASRAK
jgi:hypothetical protein